MALYEFMAENSTSASYELRVRTSMHAWPFVGVGCMQQLMHVYSIAAQIRVIVPLCKLHPAPSCPHAGPHLNLQLSCLSANMHIYATITTPLVQCMGLHPLLPPLVVLSTDDTNIGDEEVLSTQP